MKAKTQEINAEVITKPLYKRGWFKNSAIAASCIGLGCLAGFLGALAFKDPIIQTVTNGSSFEVDEAYMKQALATYNAAKEDGKPYSEVLSPDQMVNLAYSFFGEQENTYTIGVGSSKAMGVVDQAIQSCTIKNGAKFFEESNSISSFVKIYNRMYEEGDTTTTYFGSNSDYSKHPQEEMSNEEYADMMGRTVSDPLIYIVSPTTIADADTSVSGDGGSSAKKNEDGTYTVEIELKNIARDDGSEYMPGVANYQKQMKSISGLTAYPVFSYCHLSFVLDADLLPIKMTAHEKYEAKMSMGISISANCEGRLTTHYIDEEKQIPSLDEQIDYSAYAE